MNEVTIYSNGICYCSVCTSLKDVKEITRIVNIINPTKSKWKKSKEKFRTGESNPHPCEKDNGRKHYLFEC